MMFKILRSNQLTVVDGVEMPQSIRKSKSGWTIMVQSNNKRVIDKIWANLYPKESFRMISEGRSNL